MFRRLLTAGLTLAITLAGRAAAKPPDLPLPQNDVLAPVVPAEVSRPAPYLFPVEAAPAPELPLFFRVRPSVRRTMVSCLLFGAHPLLALTPTEEYVEYDEGDVWAAEVPPVFDLYLWQQQAISILGVATRPGGDFDHSLWKRDPQTVADAGTGGVGAAAPADAPPQPQEGQAEHLLCGFHPNQLIEGISDPATPPVNDLSIPIAGHARVPTTSAPSKGDDPTSSVCPWMRQRQCAPACRALSADVDLSHDVLDNLELLRQAHELLEDARELGRSGGTWEALDCLRLAHDLCPNLWIDEKIQEASAEVFGSSFADKPQAEASPALQPCQPPVDPRVSEALDGLYPETSPAVQLTAGEDDEEPLAGVAKPFVKADGLAEVGRAKDGGSPMSCVDVLREFAALVPPDHGELFFGLDGSVRVFTQIYRGDAVWRMLYDNGALSVWASPDGGADAAAPDENPPDDPSGD